MKIQHSWLKNKGNYSRLPYIFIPFLFFIDCDYLCMDGGCLHHLGAVYVSFPLSPLYPVFLYFGLLLIWAIYLL